MLYFITYMYIVIYYINILSLEQINISSRLKTSAVVRATTTGPSVGAVSNMLLTKFILIFTHSQVVFLSPYAIFGCILIHPVVQLL